MLVLYSLMTLAVDAFSLAEWTAKHGLIYHPEKLRWEKAARVCMKNGGHLVTIDCGSKEGHVREFLKEKKVDESIWIGLNKIGMSKRWNWHHSDSSSYSYANFVDGTWPIDENCVLMKRGNARHWLGAKCTTKRAFLCESNFIYPEVDIEQYNVTVDIDSNGAVQVKLNVKFDPVLDGDSRDVPLTLVVPKSAVISKFNMLIEPEHEYQAVVKDCNNCNQIFKNSTQEGQMTAKLWRSKTLRGLDYRVLTIYTNLCGHHESSFELRYHYNLVPSKKRSIYNFAFRLAPGTIVGQIDFKVNIAKSLRSRSNIEKVLEPSCKKTEDYLQSRVHSTCSPPDESSSSSSFVSQTASRSRKRRNHIHLEASSQRKFHRDHGLKRWVKMSLRERKKATTATTLTKHTLDIESGLNFPVFTGRREQCQALLIVTE